MPNSNMDYTSLVSKHLLGLLGPPTLSINRFSDVIFRWTLRAMLQRRAPNYESRVLNVMPKYLKVSAISMVCTSCRILSTVLQPRLVN